MEDQQEKRIKSTTDIVSHEDLQGDQASAQRQSAFRPTVERLVRVAAGLESWTEHEEAQLAENPDLQDYIRRLAKALKNSQAAIGASRKESFSDRVRDQSEKENPPKRS